MEATDAGGGPGTMLRASTVTAAASAANSPTERQTRILVLVVREYIETAQPVPSSRLVRRYRLAVSPATVRSDMAALEECGLLTHPHTSAGRVPTVAGYRYFAENLLTRAQLPARQRQSIRTRFVEAGWDPERWMQLSAAMIAQASGAAGLVAALGYRSAPLRRVEMVDLGGGVVQVVVVLANGDVRQVRWCPLHEYDQTALDRISRVINGRMAGADHEKWSDFAAASDLDQEAIAAVRELVQAAVGPTALRLYHAGLAHILYEPEFLEGGPLREVIAILEHGEGLETVLGGLRLRGADVLIGGEPPLEQLPRITLILSRFGGRTRQDGVLGVVGPTRLPYERAVPAVEYVAELMTDLLAGRPIAAA